MTLMPHLRKSGLFPLLAFVSSVAADYYIDDTNITLTYFSGPKAAWVPYAAGGKILKLLYPNGTYHVIDTSACWNHTFRYAACSDTDDCSLIIPFTGSGITLFVYQAGPVGINASITVDGAQAQTNVLSAPPAPAYKIANVSMFDVQQLPSGPHTLSLLVNDLSGSYSGMMFDYAYVNESLVVNSTTSAMATSIGTAVSTSAPATSSSGSHINIGAIVGGVIALVAVIVASVLVFVWMRRRRGHVPEMIDLHPDSPSPSFHTISAYDVPLTNTVATHDPYNPSTGNISRSRVRPSRSAYMPLVPNRLGSSDARPSSLCTGQEIPSPLTTANTQNPKTFPAVSKDTGNVPSDARQDINRPPLLTDEQADFINILHHNNVPAATIARVMERMLTDRHAGIRKWERETRLARTNTMTTILPSYDLVAEGG